MTRRSKGYKQLAALLLICSACASAPEEKIEATGPSVIPCQIDSKKGGYQCAAFDQTPFILRFEDASPMECYSVVDLEAFLKACKQKISLLTPQCNLNKKEVSCVTPLGQQFSIDLEKLDGYVCFNEKDIKRIKDRCKA